MAASSAVSFLQDACSASRLKTALLSPGHLGEWCESDAWAYDRFQHR